MVTQSRPHSERRTLDRLLAGLSQASFTTLAFVAFLLVAGLVATRSTGLTLFGSAHGMLQLLVFSLLTFLNLWVEKKFVLLLAFPVARLVLLYVLAPIEGFERGLGLGALLLLVVISEIVVGYRAVTARPTRWSVLGVCCATVLFALAMSLVLWIGSPRTTRLDDSATRANGSTLESWYIDYGGSFGARGGIHAQCVEVTYPVPFVERRAKVDSGCPIIVTAARSDEITA